MPDYFTLEEMADVAWVLFLETVNLAPLALTPSTLRVVEGVFKNGYARGARDELRLQKRRLLDAET